MIYYILITTREKKFKEIGLGYISRSYPFNYLVFPQKYPSTWNLKVYLAKYFMLSLANSASVRGFLPVNS